MSTLIDKKRHIVQKVNKFFYKYDRPIDKFGGCWYNCCINVNYFGGLTMLKRLISLILIITSLLSVTSCNLFKKDHHTPVDPSQNQGDSGSNDNEQTSPTVYVYSVLSKSIHLAGCYHINEIKEDYKKETTEDITPLLEKGYTLCKDCFPPAVEPEPEEPEEPGIPKEDATFLINKNSKKIHKLDCYHIEEMSEANIKYTDLSLEELLADEHIPCATCMPDEWEIYKQEHPELFPEE